MVAGTSTSGRSVFASARAGGGVGDCGSASAVAGTVSTGGGYAVAESVSDVGVADSVGDADGVAFWATAAPPSPSVAVGRGVLVGVAARPLRVVADGTCVAVRVAVDVAGCGVAVALGVVDGAGVFVFAGCGVFVSVAVRVGVRVGVLVGAELAVGVLVGVGVSVGVPSDGIVTESGSGS